MPDPLDAPERDDPHETGSESLPWEGDPPPEDPDAPRQRHDAFTEARKCEFLRALVKTGCVLDASAAPASLRAPSIAIRRAIPVSSNIARPRSG